MTDLLVGATAGLSSSASIENTAGQASSGTQTINPLCHMPTKRTELLRTDINYADSLPECEHAIHSRGRPARLPSLWAHTQVRPYTGLLPPQIPLNIYRLTAQFRITDRFPTVSGLSI